MNFFIIFCVALFFNFSAHAMNSNAETKPHSERNNKRDVRELLKDNNQVLRDIAHISLVNTRTQAEIGEHQAKALYVLNNKLDKLLEEKKNSDSLAKSTVVLSYYPNMDTKLVHLLQSIDCTPQQLDSFLANKTLFSKMLPILSKASQSIGDTNQCRAQEARLCAGMCMLAVRVNTSDPQLAEDAVILCERLLNMKKETKPIEEKKVFAGSVKDKAWNFEQELKRQNHV